MTTQSMSRLPPHWVAEIFRRMQGGFGSAWVSRWQSGEKNESGIDTGLANAMITWGEELGTFGAEPKRLKYALDTAVGKASPCSLGEFKQMCRDAPVTESFKSLPRPAIEPAIIDKRIEEMCATVGRPKTDYKKWAKDLREEYLAGKSLLPIQIEFASEALGETWKNRQCIENFSAPVEV